MHASVRVLIHEGTAKPGSSVEKLTVDAARFSQSPPMLDYPDGSAQQLCSCSWFTSDSPQQASTVSRWGSADSSPGELLLRGEDILIRLALQGLSVVSNIGLVQEDRMRRKRGHDGVWEGHACLRSKSEIKQIRTHKTTLFEAIWDDSNLLGVATWCGNLAWQSGVCGNLAWQSGVVIRQSSMAIWDDGNPACQSGMPIWNIHHE